MSNHTPGPWQLRYALLDPQEVRAVGDADGSFVADCATTSRSIEEIAANARLIAAAPDLLHEIEAALQWWDEFSRSETMYVLKPVWVEYARAAIVKARKGQTENE